MNSEQVNTLGIVALAVALAFAVVSCGKKSDQEEARAVGTAQQAGIGADRVASNAVEAAKEAAVQIQEASGKAVDKTGEILEKAGEEIEETGQNLQQ